MASSPHEPGVQLDTLAKDLDAKHNEIIEVEGRSNEVPAEWLQQFPLIADKSCMELKKLEKSLLRKLDWIFLPTVTMMLLMGYLDRINVANARLAGLQDDLGMSDEMWSLGISMFYIGKGSIYHQFVPLND